MIVLWTALTLGLGGVTCESANLPTLHGPPVSAMEAWPMAQAEPDTLRLPAGWPETFPLLPAGGDLAGVTEVPREFLAGRIDGPYHIVTVAMDVDPGEAHQAYLNALTEAGWTIDEALTNDGSRPGTPTVAFVGYGHVGDVRFEVVAGFTLATIHMRTAPEPAP